MAYRQNPWDTLPTSSRLLSVSEAARALGLPGPWTLRRLEARGIVPMPRRSFLRRDRWYSAEDIEVAAAALVRHRIRSDVAA